METILFITIVLITTMCMTAAHIASTPTLGKSLKPDNLQFGDTERPTCRMGYCNDMSSESDIDCSCDDLCWRRRDCCLNYLNQTNVDNQTFYFGIQKAHIERGRLYQCSHEVDPTAENSDVSMVSMCGASDKDSNELWQWQKSLCEQPIRHENVEDSLLRIPVTSSETGETYKNIYCAACHDDFRNVVPWTTRVDCLFQKVTNVSEAMQNLYANEIGKHPICHLRIEPSGENKAIKCFTTRNPDVISECPTSFLNASTSPDDEDKRKEIEWLCQVTSGFVNVDYIPYKSLYCAACNLNETDIATITRSKHGHCDNNKPIYHIESDGALTLWNSFPVLMDFNIFSTSGNQVGVNKRCSSGYIYDKFTDKCRSIVCSKGYHFQNSTCIHRQRISSKSVANAGTNTSSNQLTGGLLEDSEDVGTVLNCSVVLIERGEASVNDNGSLTVNQRKLYPKGTFQLVDNETIYVCVDSNDNYVFDFRDDAHTYLTLVCISLSLLALLLKMIMFALISEIRKFPDRLVFCLCASLFMAQLLFLSSSSSATNYIACASVGVLTHYFFLSSFCWMSVLAYDICNTFTKCNEARSIDPDSMKRRFYCYSLYAWVTPMLIVSAACVFDWSGIVDESSVMRPHYGVDLCWISRRTALLFYFAMPMALLLLANTVFFVLTAVSICRSSRASSMVHLTANSRNCCQKQSQPHHLRFSIYVKLAMIMGLTWMSGFVAAFSGQQWLWYVFTLSSASQGVYILIALTPFKKVLQIVQQRFRSEIQ